MHWHGATAGLSAIVTVTTMLYVEWGRLGEIGDLYVLPYGTFSIAVVGCQALLHH
jgi:hypothetical protein